MGAKYTLLDTISSPVDLRRLKVEELDQLAKELREFLLDTVSKTSGHLSSGLGVVELTIALHYVYETPFDQLVWDVGHQAYPHKILTGRKDQMSSIRKKDGLHPFLWRAESEYDVFSTGHASTSIGQALGLAIANRTLNNRKKVVAVIGDGALSGGVAFEALNHAGGLKENMLIILNDNEMSISESVGSLTKHLAMLLSSPSYEKIISQGEKALDFVPKIKDFAVKAHEHLKGMVTPGTLFEELGFNYVGPIDGHDLPTLISVLKNMKELSGPQLLHVATKKGKGYEPAEKNPTMYHGVDCFDLEEGVVEKQDCQTFSRTFGEWLLETAKKNDKVVAITPAMCHGSGMTDFAKLYPSRYFDVAIAEQHALLLASGLARGGLKPVVSVYSSFLQRAYDQIIHDVAIQDLPVVIAVDRAGVVGQDGPTHQGVFDISFLKSIPNMIVAAPSSIQDFWGMMNAAIKSEKPVAVRYPRGTSIENKLEKTEDESNLTKSKTLKVGQHVAILVWGPLVHEVLQAAKDSEYAVIDMRMVKPIDYQKLDKIGTECEFIVTVEDGVINGGVGQEVASYIQEKYPACIVKNIGIPDEFVEQDTPTEIYKNYKMDGKSVVKLCDFLMHQNKEH